MAHLPEAIDEMKSRVWAAAEHGLMFEKMVLAALRAHPGEYGPARFSKVWAHNDWPGRGGADIGIDIVAEQTEAWGGGLCAIQCKLYEGQVPAAEIDKFLAAAAGGKWAARILVTTGGYSKVSARKLSDAAAEVVTRFELDAWPTDWRKIALDPGAPAVFADQRHVLRPDQEKAVGAAVAGLSASGKRGRLLMPCGTGKSLVGLRIAERLAGAGRRVLYLVPSISLMDQTMRMWSQQRDPAVPHRYLGVCSDDQVGASSEDMPVAGLPIPVTTDPARIAARIGGASDREMSVCFSTYQSLDKIGEAQRAGCPAFDVAICDEAHRTAGGADKLFARVHDEAAVNADRRLYMTATQRIYRSAKAGGQDIISMEDEAVFGPILYQMSFGEAIERELLTDYKVLAVLVKEGAYGDWLHTLEGAKTEGLEVDLGEPGKPKPKVMPWQEVARLLGCWDALADPNSGIGGPVRAVGEPPPGDRPDGWPGHCRRAIAFTTTISKSKQAAKTLQDLAKAAISQRGGDPAGVELATDHVDGGMNAHDRAAALDRLRSPDSGPFSAHLLSNARCLTEGVDVPALDAVLFLAPRNSEIDIVQAIGRVMRKSEGKDIGYVVLPVLVPEDRADQAPERLEKSDYAEVFKVLRALRSHDERLDAIVNFQSTAPDIPVEVIDAREAVAEGATGGEPEDDADRPRNEQGRFRFEIPQQIASMIVEEVGDRQYWPSWGRRAKTAYEAVLKRCADFGASNDKAEKRLQAFAKGLRETVMPHITDREAAEMLAMHVVTIPVFNAFFQDSKFAAHNPVSRQVNGVLNALASLGCGFDDVTEPLAANYDRIKKVLADADHSERLDKLREVYEGFFKTAIPDVVERLGVVYTPLPVVDFILRSADAVCRKEFGRGLGSDGVTVMDPFAGTGTFLTRMFDLELAPGEPLLTDAQAARKYKGPHPEILAQEILLLAYYIAAVQIEECAAARGVFDDGYEPYAGVALVDTFESSADTMRERRQNLQQEMWDMGSDLPENANRVDAIHSRAPVKVIVGNPPWSAGQKSAGDDNPRADYDEIARRVRETYGKRQAEITGRSGGGNSSGNLYVQAIRWATDRLQQASDDGDTGWMVAFVHPNSLTTATSLAGARAALRDEFTSIYVVNLRGDAAKSGEERRNEGDGVFGYGSRNGVQITVLVRNPDHSAGPPAVLRYAEVPDAQSIDQKFEWLESLGDIASDELSVVPVNDRHDWANITDGGFYEMLPVCDTDKNILQTAVVDHASGVKTNCDDYVYSFSRDNLEERVRRLIDLYDAARAFVHQGNPSKQQIIERVKTQTVNDRLDTIKWTGALQNSLRKGEVLEFDPARIREVLYRPFQKLWLYEDYRILSAGKAVSAMFPASQHDNAVMPDGRVRPSGSRPSPENAPSGHRGPPHASNPDFAFGHAVRGVGGDDASGSGEREKSAREHAGATAGAPSDELAGGGGERSWSSHRRTAGRSSGRSPAGSSPISAPPGATSQRGRSRAGDLDRADAAAPVRGDGGHVPAGPVRDRPSDAGAAAVPPPDGRLEREREMVLVASPNNMAIPGALACRVLPDLHAVAAGQATRAIPRRRSS